MPRHAADPRLFACQVDHFLRWNRGKISVSHWRDRGGSLGFPSRFNRREVYSESILPDSVARGGGSSSWRAIAEGAMSRSEPNSYSPCWFEFFHLPITGERTKKEVEFICGVAPLPQFRNVLDLCCGMGRHARALVDRGYAVTGIERDAGAIEKARELGGGPTYVHADIRDHQPAHAAYDVAIVMSQSFGYFDARTNRDILQRLADAIRPGGRIILDLWNPEFFRAHQGARNLETPGGVVREQKQVKDGRLFVSLAYPEGEEERFEWTLFTPAEMCSLAKCAGLELIETWTEFDFAAKPNPANPRLQFVLRKK
jgi:SAM-dependent methyltransferase